MSIVRKAYAESHESKHSTPNKGSIHFILSSYNCLLSQHFKKTVNVQEFEKGSSKLPFIPKVAYFSSLSCHLETFKENTGKRQHTRARGSKRLNYINYSVFWKTILNKWFGLRINVFPLLTHFHSVNRKVFILMTSFQFLLLVRSEAKTICCKSKLFSFSCAGIHPKSSPPGLSDGSKGSDTTERSPLHVTELNSFICDHGS